MSAMDLLRSGAVVAVEIAFIYTVTWLATRRVLSAYWRRTMWQSALVGMFLVCAGEISGIRALFGRSPELPRPVQMSAVSELVFTPPQTDFVALEEISAPLNEFSTLELPDQVHERSAFSTSVVAAWCWGAGAAVLIIRVLVALGVTVVFRMVAEHVTNPRLLALLGKLRHLFNLRREIRLRQTGRVATPFTFGVVRPVIVLPRQFSNTFDPEQQELALAHELAHVAAFDALWRVFANALCALLWWHPAVWLAQRELSYASEAVADEASLHIENGPARLAECLLECARQVPPLQRHLWIGMAGFRSNIGRRIERLTNMVAPSRRVSRPMSWLTRLAMPAVVAVLLWATAATVLPASATAGWRSSIVGRIWGSTHQAPDAEPKLAALASSVQGVRINTNEGAEQASGTNALATATKRERILEKLRTIRFKEMHLDRLPLPDFLKLVNDSARQLDPEGEGVKVMLESGPKSNELTAVTISISNPLYNITLEELLNVAGIVADKRLIWTIVDTGVVIAFRPADPVPLHTRFFKVDPAMLLHALQKRFPEGKGDPAGGGIAQNRPDTNTAPAAAVVPLAKRYFSAAGVNLDQPGKAVFFNDRRGVLMIRATLNELQAVEAALKAVGASADRVRESSDYASLVQTGKSLFEDGDIEGARMFLLKAVEAHTNATAAKYYLALLNARHAHSKIPRDITDDGTSHRTEEYKISAEALVRSLDDLLRFHAKGKGYSLLSGPPVVTNATAMLNLACLYAGVSAWQSGNYVYFEPTSSEVRVRGAEHDIEVLGRLIALMLGQAPQVQITLRTVTVPGPGSTSAPLLGVLSEQELRRFLDSRGPQIQKTFNPVTVQSGKPATFDLGTSNADSGSSVAESLQLVPYVQSNGVVQLTMLPAFREFIGQLKPTDTDWATGGPYAPENRVGGRAPHQPRYGLRQTASSVRLYDGQSAVLGRSKLQEDSRSAAYLVTLRLVDENGRPIRSDEEIRAFTNSPYINTVSGLTGSGLRNVVPSGVPSKSFALHEPPQLYTKFFKVDPTTFARGVNGTLVRDPKTGAIKRVFNEPEGSNSISARLEALLNVAGADLQAPGKAFLFNEETATLMVRGDKRDIDAVERAVELVNMAPPQLHIEIKASEIPVAALRSLSVKLPTLGKAAREVTADGATSNAPTRAAATVITRAQYDNVLRALEAVPGVDVLSVQPVTTMSGRQAQIKVVDVRYVVTDLQISTNSAPQKVRAWWPFGGTPRKVGEIQPITQPFELGPIMDVMPRVEADGRTIQLSVLPTLREFLGYDDPGVFQAETGEGLVSPTPLPKFRLRQVTATARVWDGQTLVVGAGDAPAKDRTRRELVFFVTPRLIDQAGNPLHSDQALDVN